MELIEELLHPLNRQRVKKRTQRLQYGVDEKVNLKAPIEFVAPLWIWAIENFRSLPD
jgi:hypothetical protein